MWPQQGKERVGRIESRTDVHTPLCVKQVEPEGCCQGAQGPQPGALCYREAADGAGAEGRPRGGDTCLHVADSHFV